MLANYAWSIIEIFSFFTTLHWMHISHATAISQLIMPHGSLMFKPLLV
jgi:hypothetical protein